MADVKSAALADPQFPRVLLIHQSTEEVANHIMGRVWPDVPAISDPERALYLGFGLQRASLWSLLRPRAVLHGLRALAKGHGVGRPRGGDVMQMPGVFLVKDEDIVWEHPFSGGAGDLPVWRGLMSGTARR